MDAGGIKKGGFMFGFVICSQNDQLAQVTKQWILKFFPPDTQIHFLKESNSIFSAYNKGIELTKDCDYVCFCHEDLDVIKIDVDKLLSKLNDPLIGFIGVAGAKKLPENGMWWSEYRGLSHPNLSGTVGHQKIDEFSKQRIRWVNTYGMYGQVKVLDGLILFCRRDLLDKIKWDEEFFSGWDFYDISITYSASKKGYINITVPYIELYHWGLGNLRNTYEENRQKFLQWKSIVII